MTRKKKNSEQAKKEIEIITNNASAFGKEITFAQASSIRRRSIKLMQESRTHPTTNQKEKDRQIERCWKLRKEGKL